MVLVWHVRERGACWIERKNAHDAGGTTTNKTCKNKLKPCGPHVRYSGNPMCKRLLSWHRQLALSASWLLHETFSDKSRDKMINVFSFNSKPRDRRRGTRFLQNMFSLLSFSKICACAGATAEWVQHLSEQFATVSKVIREMQQDQSHLDAPRALLANV